MNFYKVTYNQVNDDGYLNCLLMIPEQTAAMCLNLVHFNVRIRADANLATNPDVNFLTFFYKLGTNSHKFTKEEKQPCSELKTNIISCIHCGFIVLRTIQQGFHHI